MPLRSAIETFIINKIEAAKAEPTVIIVDDNLDDVCAKLTREQRENRMREVQRKIHEYLNPLFDGDIAVCYRSCEAKWVSENIEGSQQRIQTVIDDALNFVGNTLANRRLKRCTITFKPVPKTQEGIVDVDIEMEHPWGMGGIGDVDDYGRVQMTNNTPPVETKHASAQFKLALLPNSGTEEALGIVAKALT